MIRFTTKYLKRNPVIKQDPTVNLMFIGPCIIVIVEG